MRRIPVTNRMGQALGLLALWSVAGGFGPAAYASDGGPHAGTFTTWNTGASPISGFDPHETIADVENLTNHVGAPAMVTSAENTCGGFCGLIFWNPDTNSFKTFCVTGGFQFALDINRGTPSGVAMTFGGGDTWATVFGNSSFSPYVNFRGSGDFRRWDGIGAFSATGIRVNATNGKVYFGDFSAGQIIELDPATNGVKKWTVGNQPYNLVLDGTFVYATGIAGGGHPDQILRLDPGTNELKRWDVPGGGFQAFVGFGTPNSIAKDQEGNIWFTESAADQLGRLNPTSDVIDEFDKASIGNPHSIASSGSGATLQAFFTEASAGQVSVLTETAAAPTSTTVTPTTETLTPAVSTATPVDFTPSMLSATIDPVVTPVMSTDPSGIDQFPIPPGHLAPTGMTEVAFPNTVFGSMEGSDHVFKFVSEIIIAPPPGNNPPECSAAAASPSELWPPNHELTAIDITGVTDPDDDPVTIVATDITQDEPVNTTGVGAGNTTPDATLDPLAVRAERNGNPKSPGNGRVYHISFTADDGKGGKCTGTVTVCVPHDQRPGATCVDEGPLFSSL